MTARHPIQFVLLMVLATASLLFVCAVSQRDGNFFGDGDRPIATDFVAFYAAGRIVADGDARRLYDADRQQTEQIRALGREPESYVPFPYPVWVAIPYAGLAHLPYFPAFLLAMSAMFLCIVPSICLLRGVSETVREAPILVGFAVAAFWPFFWGVTNGQTIPFWLLCLVGTYAALRRGRDKTAGIWMGLLLGKPQLAILLLCLMIWRRRWRTVGVTAAVGGVLSLSSAVLAGISWPRSFIAFATGGDYNLAEIERAGILHVSLNGVAAKLLGPTNPWTVAVAVVLTLSVAAGVARAWRGAEPTDGTFPLQFGLAVAATLAVSPHALFYDTPLLLLPTMAIVDRWRADAEDGGEVFTPRRRLLLVGLFVAGFGWQLAWVATIQPLAILPVAVGVAVARALMRRGDEAPFSRHDLARYQKNLVSA